MSRHPNGPSHRSEPPRPARTRKFADGSAERTAYHEWSAHMEAGISTLASTPVEEVMRHELVCISEDATVNELIALLLDRDLHGVAVVDEDALLVGYVSMTDIERDRWENGDTREVSRVRIATRSGGSYDLGPGFHVEESPKTVRDVMSPVAIEVPEGASLSKAAAVMAKFHVHQLPVVDDAGHVLGLLDAGAILDWLLGRRTPPIPRADGAKQ